MPTYFHGWRRKLGVVTLVITRVLAGLWMRSLEFEDRLYKREVPHIGIEYFVSEGGGLGWKTQHSNLSDPDFPFIYNDYFEFFGFRYGFKSKGFSLATYLIIPYWSIIIPLSLLSAYLLLSKPRVAKNALVGDK